VLNPKRLELKHDCHESKGVEMGVLSTRVCYLQGRHKDFCFILFTFLVPVCLFPL